MNNNRSDEAEFRIFYNEHYISLCRTAYRIVHDKDTASEIVQEIFVDIWTRGNWKELKNPGAYLYVAVYNRCIKLIKKGRKLVSDDILTLQSAGMKQIVEEEELQQIIAQGIASLPEQCRAIFVLSREGEMTYREIAAQMDLSEKTVENQMGIALKKLRAHMDKHGYG